MQVDESRPGKPAREVVAARADSLEIAAPAIAVHGAEPFGGIRGHSYVGAFVHGNSGWGPWDAHFARGRRPRRGVFVAGRCRKVTKCGRAPRSPAARLNSFAMKKNIAIVEDERAIRDNYAAAF